MKNILLIGKNGQVGWELERTLRPLGRVTALDRRQMDLTKPDTIREGIRTSAPSIIFNAAGYTAVDKAEAEPELAMQVNATAPGIMAEEAKRLNALLIHYSTDYVFNGLHSTPYVEDDEPDPVNVYGKSKLEGERAITSIGCAYLVLRTSWIYSKRETNFVLTMLKLARDKKVLDVVDDQIGSPTWARALAESTSELAEKAFASGINSGIYHLSASDSTSRFDFAAGILAAIKEVSGIKTGWAHLRSTTTENYPLPARRPLNAATDKSKIIKTFGIEMPTWKVQLHQLIGELALDLEWRRQMGF